MDFRKKIKIRMYVGLAEFLFAVALIAICAYGTNAQIGMFGTMLAVIALKNIRKNLAYLKNDEKLRKEEQMTKQEDHVRKQVLDTLESYEQLLKEEHLEKEEAFERVKEVFGKEVAAREELTEHTLSVLEHAFEFMEDAFGDSQEMVSFVTELNTNYYSIQFLKENDCDKYYQYNKKLLFDKQQEEILSEMDEIEQDLNTTLK